jgi:hypothetical protein
LSNGQAGAADAAALLDESKPAAFPFGSAQDSFDLADRCVEYGRRWMDTNDVDFVKAYNELRAYIVARVSASFAAGKCDLIFRAIPFRVKAFERFRFLKVVNDHRCANYTDGRKGSMSGIAKFVESPKGLIPSLVWAEPAKKRQDFSGQIAATASFDDILKSSNIVPKRKVGVFRSWHVSCHRRGVTSLIENGAKCEQSLKSKIIAGGGNTLSKFDLVRLVDSIGIRLDKSLIWLTVFEPPKVAFEVLNVSLCADEPALRTVERIDTGKYHGRQKTRSDERPRISKGGPSSFKHVSKASFRNEAR